jgi:hypothetical protein
LGPWERYLGVWMAGGVTGGKGDTAKGTSHGAGMGVIEN